MKQALRNEERTYGVELEIILPTSLQISRIEELASEAGIIFKDESARYHHTTRPYWKGMYDSSIQTSFGWRALEIVSPILKGTQGLADLEKMCSILAQVGAKVNKSCGLHVHHDAGDFASKNFDNIKVLYSRVEKHIDDFMPPSRKGNNNRWCKSVAGEFTNWSDRYHKLNLTSFGRHGTIEFRHHSGSIEFKKIAAWIHITQAIMERAKMPKFRASVPDQGKFFSALRMWECNQESPEMKEVATEVREYVRKRASELAA